MNSVPRDQEPGQKSGSNKVRSIFEGMANVPPLARPRSASIALVSNFAPRKCGIATFATDIFQSLGKFHPEISLDVYALHDPAQPVDYVGVAGTITCNDPDEYARAAREINESGVDAVWLQHEFGIFGGQDGDMVRHLVDRLAPPLILTLHTVLLEPSPHQRATLDHLITRASRIMVMSRYSRDLLVREYRVAADLIDVIEHGAPDRPFGRQDKFKAHLNLSGRKVLTTFGLLGPGKGLEHAIGALPAIIARHPDAIYRIVGATHPNLVASEGEAYRSKLEEMAEELGVAAHIDWDNRFLETDELLDQLEACDIYLTPYPNLQQSTSGTLSFAVALGKAVVSTGYVHARELLGDGVGVIIEPGSAEKIANAVIGLLDDPQEMAAVQRRAWARGREMIWPRFADAVADLIDEVRVRGSQVPSIKSTPGLSTVLAMSDGTGMLQHGIGVVPDRRHGYCLDDNARALMLMNVAHGLPAGERMKWSLVYASFVQHAWNPDAQRFRNFMRFDRSWCEDVGSEDSNGRAIWALGHTFEKSRDAGLSDWAMNLYDEVLTASEDFDAPRSVAFSMLGACAVLRREPSHAASRARVESGGAFLMKLLGEGRRPDWGWFEAVLGYDNPRLPQALIEAGVAMDREEWIGAGLATLEWICAEQVSAKGHFRPIGSETFHKPYTYLPFDQQPLEAQAAIEAAMTAWRVTKGLFWSEHAVTAWRWFFGGNDRGEILADIATGRCRDGVTPRGANTNCGAESILAFQLSHYALAQLAISAPLAPGGGWIEPAREHLV